MGYLQAIKRLKAEDNLGGLQQIQVCRKSDIESIPDPSSDRTIYGDIVLKAGASFVTWDVTFETLGLKSSGQANREGNSKSNVLAFTVPKGRASLSQMFSLAEEDEFVVVYTENGRQKIFGLLYAPARFVFNHDSGKNIGDLNSYECQFFYTGPDNIYFYAGDIAAPTGPAPALVYFNGEVIAGLAPGESLHIESEYSLDGYFVTS